MSITAIRGGISTPPSTSAEVARPEPRDAPPRRARLDLEIEKTRFEVPPDQVLVVRSGAPDGEARVRLEPAAPEPGSLFHDVG